jgi:hypothetical protein
MTLTATLARLRAAEARVAALTGAARAVLSNLAIVQRESADTLWCCVCDRDAHHLGCPVGALAALLEEP